MPSAPVRLFRHDRRFRHEGFLHQSVAPSIQRAGGRVGTAEAFIHHYGHLRGDRAKSSLYMALARRQTLETPTVAQVWIDLGQPLLERAQYPAAVTAFRRAHALGRSASASFWLAETLLAMEQPAAALPYLREAIARNVGDQARDFDLADAWEGLARALEALGRGRQAIAAYRRALALRPDSPMASNDLAGLLAERGATREAGALLDDLLGRYPGLDMPWATLGTLRASQGEPALAAWALERALAIEPRSRPARRNLAVCRALAAGRRPPREVPAEERPRGGRRLQAMAARGVVNLIAHFGGGAGRVLVDIVRGLRGRPQCVVCFDTDEHTHQGLRAELRRAGVRLVTVDSERELHAVLRRLRPETVIHHWWPNRVCSDVVRVGGERWIALGHAAAPTPPGYDDYVVISDFHASRQRHLPAARVHRISNGIDLPRFTRRRHTARRPVTIAMVSRLDPGKFSRRLLDYLPRLDTLGARLLIAGRGGRRFELEPEIAARGLSDVIRFVGPIPTQKVPRFLAGADIGLHVTETAEETGCLSVVEMLATGLPVVAEPKGCMPELVIPDVNGFLSLEPKQVAAALERLILSLDLRRRMGAAGRSHARRWDMPRFQRQWRALLNGRRAPAGEERQRIAPRRYAPWRPALTYFVCSTPRAGGGLLCEALANTGLAGQPDDFFEPETARVLAARWGERPFSAYLERALEEGATPNGVFGARLTPAGLHLLRREVDIVRAFPNLRCVWIARRDRLRQATSWIRARQTGVWARMAGEPAPATPRGRLDPRELARCLVEIEAQERAWQAWFVGAGVTPIRVAYEELAADYEGTARRVVRQLGIALPRRMYFGERRMLAMAE